MMSNLEEVTKLNCEAKLRLAPSKVHGVGVFALRDISKGEKLYADHMPIVYKLAYSNFGKLFPEIKDMLLERWPQIVSGSAFIFPDARMLAYMNHSSEPNYDASKDVAVKDIAKGEEVFEDYRKIKGWEQVFPWLDKETKLTVI